MSLIV
ncbi:hypothetical protein AYI70_g10770, partial [Smittium culicis]